MTAKEYFRQAYYLDQCINSKLEHLESLNAIANKATSVFSEMPRNPNRNIDSLANAVDKIIDLQEEINQDIDRFVDLKHEIVALIKGIEVLEYQIILEKRYLNFLSWEQIAADMNYGIDNVFRAHKKALSLVSIPKTLQ